MSKVTYLTSNLHCTVIMLTTASVASEFPRPGINKSIPIQFYYIPYSHLQSQL